METIYLGEEQQVQAQRRNEAFWKGELDDGPLMWVTAPGAKPTRTVPEPATEDELWTNVDYVIAATESALAGTHYAGDALPVFCPWLGPDQFAAWLGADLLLRPRQSTSWSKPFVRDWDGHPALQIDPANRWWRIYLQVLRESVRAGKGKWVTGYPDLHSGIDALSAIRGAEDLAADLVTCPEAIHRAMRQVTDLWKFVVDAVSAIVLPAGQGTSNWTMGWSEQRFLCIGQNDYSCMISPQMFEEFCRQETSSAVPMWIERSITWTVPELCAISLCYSAWSGWIVFNGFRAQANHCLRTGCPCCSRFKQGENPSNSITGKGTAGMLT